MSNTSSTTYLPTGSSSSNIAKDAAASAAGPSVSDALKRAKEIAAKLTGKPIADTGALYPICCLLSHFHIFLFRV